MANAVASLPPPSDGDVGPCEVCSSRGYRALYTKNGYWLVQCLVCGVMFAHPRPSLSRLQSAYTEGEVGAGAPTGDSREFEAYEYRFRPFLELVRTYGKRGRILDVGCWNGQFLSLLGPEWEKHGVELSGSASAYARSQGLDVVTGTIHDVPYPAGMFRVVTMWDVIEHVPKPTDDLRKAVDLLEPDGLLFIHDLDTFLSAAEEQALERGLAEYGSSEAAV